MLCSLTQAAACTLLYHVITHIVFQTVRVCPVCGYIHSYQCHVFLNPVASLLHIRLYLQAVCSATAVNQRFHCLVGSHRAVPQKHPRLRAKNSLVLLSYTSAR